MSQATPPPFPPSPSASSIPPTPSLQSPAVPTYPPMHPGLVGSYQRGPIGGPACPYQPQTFASLYLWWAILLGSGVFLCATVIGLPLGVPAVIASIVLSSILLFKFWNQIQDGHQRTSAGLAVGLCFVPFFHFYWVFVAVFGLSQDLNAFCRRYGVNTPPVNEGLALAYCILCCCLIVPYLNLLVLIGVLVIQFILYQQFKTTSMAVAHAKLAATAHLMPPPMPPAPPAGPFVPLMAR